VRVEPPGEFYELLGLAAGSILGCHRAPVAQSSSEPPLTGRLSYEPKLAAAAAHHPNPRLLAPFAPQPQLADQQVSPLAPAQFH